MPQLLIPGDHSTLLEALQAAAASPLNPTSWELVVTSATHLETLPNADTAVALPSGTTVTVMPFPSLGRATVEVVMAAGATRPLFDVVNSAPSPILQPASTRPLLSLRDLDLRFFQSDVGVDAGQPWYRGAVVGVRVGAFCRVRIQNCLALGTWREHSQTQPPFEVVREAAATVFLQAGGNDCTEPYLGIGSQVEIVDSIVAWFGIGVLAQGDVRVDCLGTALIRCAEFGLLQGFGQSGVLVRDGYFLRCGLGLAMGFNDAPLPSPTPNPPLPATIHRVEDTAFSNCHLGVRIEERYTPGQSHH